MRQNKQFNLNLSSCRKVISLLFDNEEFRKKLLGSDFIKKYIPSPNINLNGQSALPRINITKSPAFHLNGNYPEFNYKGHNFNDILFLAEYMLERLRQEDGLYSIHSSCAEKKGKAVLLYGWKDTGKTSTALHLAREYGFNFLSEGRTVIDNSFNISGTIKFLEEDNDFLKEKYNFNENCLDISKICNMSNQASKLSLLVYPQITNTQLEVKIWDDDKNKYHFYEQFSQVIRGVAKNINDYSCPIDSIDTMELAIKRTQFINHLSQSFKTYQIRGSLESICDTINQII